MLNMIGQKQAEEFQLDP